MWVLIVNFLRLCRLQGVLTIKGQKDGGGRKLSSGFQPGLEASLPCQTLNPPARSLGLSRAEAAGRTGGTGEA